jgi:SpoVK/Ycf46/Vps4 family AAA+-type ATPase
MQDIIEETKTIIQSGTSAIHLAGDDYSQIDEFVKGLARSLRFEETNEDGEPKPAVVEWNYGYGQVDFKTGEQIQGGGGGKMPLDEFLGIYKTPANSRKKIILVRNARHVLEGEMNRENLARLQRTILHIRKYLPGKAALVYCDERRFIPDELSSLVHFVELKPPNSDELGKLINGFVEQRGLELDDATRVSIASMCVGMSKDSFVQMLKKAALKKESFADEIKPTAKKAKKQIVDKSGLLEYVEVDASEEDVGGLEHLKWWLRQKQRAFEKPEEAKEAKVKPAKGILLAGMPGCGKSLSSKAVANKFKLPILKFDLGSLMGKYLGESEEKLRRALKIAEGASPCVLWVDEIEKAFAGLSGDETGVSQRLFGYLLTWLNDNKARVFVVATANDVAVLPPEFLRRGRFDEIFYVDFPNAAERRSIFEIHFKSVLGKVPDFTDAEWHELCRDQKKKKVTKKEKFVDEWGNVEEKDVEREEPDTEADKNYFGTEGYAGSDIAALVNIVHEAAWKADKKIITIDMLKTQRNYLTPLKEVLADKIAKNKAKFGQYKLTSASYDEKNNQRFEVAINGSEEDQLEALKDERCPADIIPKIAKKGTEAVKLAALENSRCGSETVIALLEDESEEVRKKAEEKMPQIEQGLLNIARTGTPAEKRLVINIVIKNIGNVSMDTRDNLCHILAKDGDKDVRLSLLEYQRLPPSVWETLANTQDEAFQKEVLEHPRCPKETCRNCKHYGRGACGISYLPKGKLETCKRYREEE